MVKLGMIPAKVGFLRVVWRRFLPYGSGGRIDRWRACFAAIMTSALRANAGRVSASRAVTCTRTSSGSWRKKIRRMRTF